MKYFCVKNCHNTKHGGYVLKKNKKLGQVPLHISFSETNFKNTDYILGFYVRITNSILTRSSQSASFTNTRMPGLLQTESYSHSSIPLPMLIRMLTNT
jgi:hypothetical protein